MVNVDSRQRVGWQGNGLKIRSCLRIVYFVIFCLPPAERAGQATVKQKKDPTLTNHNLGLVAQSCAALPTKYGSHSAWVAEQGLIV